MRNPALSGDPPKSGKQPEAAKKQGQPASHAPLVNSPAPNGNQGSHACPGTGQTKLDCNAVTAIAATRQADAAEYFNNVVWVEIGVGAATALFAYLAARWARKAAEAATKSFKAFVAAEDAHLVLDFRQGPYGSWNDSGVTKVNYSFKITVSNVGRSAARLQQIIFSNSEGSMARSFGETLKPDASTELSDWLLIMADDPKANVSITYATSLHPVTTFEAVVGMDVIGNGQKATAYIASSRIGRPKTK